MSKAQNKSESNRQHHSKRATESPSSSNPDSKRQQTTSHRGSKTNVNNKNMSKPNLNSDDFYEILGCSKSATEADLKKAYRKLAVKWHPDKNPGNDQATKNFQKISEAFATLSDPKKRKLYDLYGVEGANASDNINENEIPTGGGGRMPGGFRPASGGAGVHHMSPEEAQAFFGSFFGGSDPFGGGFGGGMGGPGASFSFSTSSGGGGPSFTRSFGNGPDPFSMMFSQGGMGAMNGMGGMGSMGGLSGIPGIQGMGMGGRSGRPSAPQPKSYDSIPPGTVVSLKGLLNAPDRNGDRGVIRQYMPQTDRYLVEIEDTNENMSVKPSNILQHVHVRIHDIQTQAELNGKTGTILAWNPLKERYNIYVSVLKKVVSLRPGNVVLDPGTVAQITGLSSRPELNGKWGTIKEWIRESNRYDVQLSAQHTIRVKVENMRV